MSPLGSLFVVAGLALIGWLLARRRAAAFRPEGPLPSDGTLRFAALPVHHAWFAALCTLLPPLLFLATWSLTSPAMVTDMVLATPAALDLPVGRSERAEILSEARGLAQGRGYGAFHAAARRLAPAYAAAQARADWIAGIAAIALAVAAGGLAVSRVRARLAARSHVERLVMLLLLGASLLAILTTAGIAGSLIYEASRFFGMVPAADFLTGTHWSPQAIDPRDPGAALGALPLFWGTFFIGAVIAMAVAVPLGLMSAIYLSQYAPRATRRRMKPLLEVLAGIPTVVYGYFAALTVAPQVRRLGAALGVPDPSSESALAAGLVMGIMIIPFVSSTADDALSAVPASLRDGSLAMGATPSETIRRVLLPAALPGVAGGILLAVSRAIGETMIVVMAASAVATLSLDPFASATTVTKQIVDLLTGEAEFDSAKTLAAFALGLTLFVVTLLLNVVALSVVRRYREAYE